jgi:hypothetical protein
MILGQSNTIDRSVCFIYFLTEFIKKDIIKNEFNIKLWCEQNFIRSDVIILYLTNLANISINIKTIERNIDG